MKRERAVADTVEKGRGTGRATLRQKGKAGRRGFTNALSVCKSALDKVMTLDAT